ncbi:MAG: Ig-like domain-containing protein [Proteobacteria bacterium]|nr:Ig-like domain-containing protein [Pseudomonadota bacterium]
MAIKESISSFIEMDIVSTSGTVLPDGIQIDELILTRSGNDLILAGPGGHKLNVRNYFNLDEFPPIVAADGNRLSGEDVAARATTLFARTDNSEPTNSDLLSIAALDPQFQTPESPSIDFADGAINSPHELAGWIFDEALELSSAELGLRFEIQSPPSNGNVVINSDGSYSYRPALGFAGTDSFTVSVIGSDGIVWHKTINLVVSEPTQPLFINSGSDIGIAAGDTILPDPPDYIREYFDSVNRSSSERFEGPPETSFPYLEIVAPPPLKFDIPKKPALNEDNDTINDIGDLASQASAFSIVATDGVKAEGTGGTTAFTFAVARSGDTTFGADVTFAVTGSGGDPTDAADFGGGVLPSGTLNFSPGETSKTLTVQVSADSTAEQSEQFMVTLSNPTNGTLISGGPATGIIQNDDLFPAPVFLDDNFDDGDFVGWTVIDQVSALTGSWSVAAQEVIQTSNIHTATPDQLSERMGTVLYWDDPAALLWSDYTADVTFRSTDDDGIGLVFYYTDENNYYKIDFDAQRSFSTLFQREAGVETVLATVAGPGYSVGVDTQLKVTISGDEITVLRDGVDVFGGAVSGGDLTDGTIGLYSWGNVGAEFDDVFVSGPVPPL